MNYQQEWQNSGVDEQLINLNVTPLKGNSPCEYLLYSDSLPRRNDGRVTHSILRRYEHTEQGGWWCSGIDLLTGDNDLWGCFKPDSPRFTHEQHKVIKYEHPPQTPTGIFALKVPLHLWQMLAHRYQIDFTTENIDNQQPDLGFWQWVIAHPSIPICITEGAKKAGALLSAGYVAIALPGINNGYRTPRDESGNRIGKSHLIPQLEKLAISGRQIYITFDQDSKPTTIKFVNAAIRQLGYLFTQKSCQVKVITWPSEWGKGVDDFIANQGQNKFDEAYQKALPLEIWKAKELTQLTYAPDIEVNSPYLEPFTIPKTAKLIGIKSPIGTGKTQVLENIVKEAIARKQKVLVIGHRIKLVEQLCQRFGLPYITEIKDNSRNECLGYGLCIDSLHENSSANFNIEDWTDGIVIIDEVEQVLWHGLNSDTCKQNRVPILKCFKTLIQTILGGQGKLFIADAHLSDISVDYLITLSGINFKPFIIKNSWKPNAKETWEVYQYTESTPKNIVKDLVDYIRQGGKPFVCLSAQKITSKWGTQTLESYLKKQFPAAKILRIDSESLTDPNHPAYQCITHLNEILAKYDIVLSSPAIETGISIDIKQHFTSVWCLAQGIQTATSVCQSLGRVRDNIPRYIWIAHYGFNQVGNGSTSIPGLLTSGHRLTQLNIRLLQQSDLEALDDLDTGFQAESLLCWAKMSVRVNASMMNYREAILALLHGANHSLKLSHQKPYQNQPKTNKSFSNLTETIDIVRKENYEAECQAIAHSKSLNEQQYNRLKKRLVKTTKERHAIKKYDLKQRYGIPIIPELVALDNHGWYQKLRLNYFLTMGRSYLADRDAIVARKLIEMGQGSLFLPDFNHCQLGSTIGTLEVLGIPVLITDPQRQLNPNDDDLMKMANLAINNRNEIKTLMGIGIAKNSSPITIIRRLLDKIGYGLTCLGLKTIAKKRVRLYQVVIPKDGREEVFKQWLLRDNYSPGSSEPWYAEYNLSLLKLNCEEPNYSNNYIQLSLDL